MLKRNKIFNDRSVCIFTDAGCHKGDICAGFCTYRNDILIDQDYKLAVLNDILCNVEYQEDGSTATMWKQYINNPKGFAFWRKICMQYPMSVKRLWIDCIHYVSESILARDKQFINNSPKKFMTILAIPFGVALSIYTKKKVKDL